MSGSQSIDELCGKLVWFCQSDSLSEDGLREILERNGCEPKNNMNIDNYDFFIMACNNDLVTEGILRCLLEYFPDAAGYTSPDGLLKPLHTILGFNKNVTLGMVQLLIDVYPESLSIANSIGYMPLHFLCGNEKLGNATAVDILSLLLEGYPEAARHADRDGGLPIHIAVESNSVDFCRMLIEAYPGSERIANSNGVLPFHVACVKGAVATAEYLYKRYPESINVADGDGRYSIHRAIVRVGNGAPAAVEMVQFLLDCDPNVASQEIQEFAPLCLVCALGFNDAVLKVLRLLYDAHPEAVEDNRIEAVFDRLPAEMQDFINAQRTYARQSRDLRQMNTPDVNGQLPLHRALCDNATLGSINLLVKGNPTAVQTPDNDGALPLHLAIQHNKSTKVVDYLVGLGTNTLTAVDREGNTALHHACRSAKYDTISLLLEHYGAVSVSKTNGHDKLPIHLLLESGATVNREGDTEYMESIFRLLRAYPDTLMVSEDIEQHQSISESSTSHVGKKRKICTD